MPIRSARGRLLVVPLIAALALSPGMAGAGAATEPSVAVQRPAAAITPGAPRVPWHLTARPWRPTYLDRTRYLDVAEGIARVDVRTQAANGAILDAYDGKEHQYTTPYFAAMVALLASHDRATDLVPAGARAMDRATDVLSRDAVPEDHGEFYIAPLATAIVLYRKHVSAERYTTWKTRMATPASKFLRGSPHNWRTYAMKGEWLRAKNGLVDKATAVAYVERSWKETQRRRLTDQWSMYRDETGDPDTHVYDAAARSNLFSLVVEGYDGPSRSEMERLLRTGARAGLLMQDPTGQNPTGGRSGDHVWNDVYSGNVFSQHAEHLRRLGEDARLAGQYRRAELLSLGGLDRWKRGDGSYSVTKNHFDPSLRVGYADYSWFSNYNGNVGFHALESHALSRSYVAEQPVPSEIGGYVMTTGPQFASAFANAGGMHMQAALRGATSKVHEQHWTVLGVSRFSRPGWDPRLGPLGAVRDPSTHRAASFAPTFREHSQWVRLENVPGRYEGKASVLFEHPLLVRWAIDYTPRAGKSGPSFRNEFVVTPDGVLSTVTSTGAAEFGTTLPVIENDGRAYTASYTNGIARTVGPGGTHEQAFIPVQAGATLTRTDAPVRGGAGTIRPVRTTAAGETRNRVFVYPRTGSDPSADAVKASFTRTGEDFSTVLGRVRGTTYVGRTSAGGFGRALDLDDDGVSDVTFSAPAHFVLQLDRGTVLAVETDRAVTGRIQGSDVSLTAYAPRSFARDLPVTASAGSAEAGNPAAHAVDGRPATTRWAANGDGQSLRLDLGARKRVGSLSLAWFKGDERTTRFDIQRSDDGVTWTDVVAGVSSSGTTTGPERYPLGVVTTRHLRIVKRPSATTWISLFDVRVSGW